MEMKQQIIEIIEKYSENIDVDDDAVFKWKWEQVAEEIEKLYNMRFLLGSIITIGKNTSKLFEGEQYKIITEETNINNVCKYELVLVDDKIPQKRVWIQRDILLEIIKI